MDENDDGNTDRVSMLPEIMLSSARVCCKCLKVETHLI